MIINSQSPPVQLDPIELNAYSKSHGFVGFFETDHLLAYASDFQRIKTYLQRQGSKHISLVSKCWVNELIVRSKKRQRSIISEGMVQDGNSKMCWKTIDLRSEQSWNLFLRLCTQLFDSEIDGHLFVITDKPGLAIYPHSDVGYGVIALDQAEREPAKILLNVFADSNHEIYMTPNPACRH